MCNHIYKLERHTIFKYFSHNGQTQPATEANIPLSSVEYSYGFGVYETIRLSKGKIFFVDDHIGRLLESAKIIGIDHPFSPQSIKHYIEELISKNEAASCNIKVLLIGGEDASSANLYIICLNPLFPDRKLFKQGAKCITYQYERVFPHAKSLNMLQSYLAYREAREVGAYDALILNHRDCITEGTRTNFFAVKDRTIISPPSEEILLGVTRQHVLDVASQNRFTLAEQDILLRGLDHYDGFFITSTSSKIMPVSSIDDQAFEIPQSVHELMSAYDQFLASL